MKKRTGKFLYRLIGGLVIFCIITYLGALYLVNYALKPNNRGKDIESSYTYMYKEYPFLKQWVDSLNQVRALKDTFILAPDGIRLHAYYVAARQPTRKTAILVHGYTDNAIRMFMLGHMYNHFLNYNILLPDLRYSGLSEGDHLQMGWNDRKDVMQWMEIANELFGDSTQMVIHGISMGGATTMMISGEKLPFYVKAFVEDCGYTSVWDQFKKELKEQFHLPAFPLLYIADAICKCKYGWSFKEANALKQVEKCNLPMYFIHGGKDTYVPTFMGIEVFHAKPQPKRLWLEPEATHATSYQIDPKAYTNMVNNFLKEYNP